jgi:hypothetical protein
MRKPFKIMLGIIVAFMCLGAVLSFTGKQNSTDSSAAESGDELAPSGWATSAKVFAARWNSEVQTAYKLDPFQGDSNSANGASANFLAGTVVLYQDMYILKTQNKDMFLPLCTQTVEAALGTSFDDAKAIVQQAYSGAASAGMDFGSVDYQGYTVDLADINNTFPACTVHIKK